MRSAASSLGAASCAGSWSTATGSTGAEVDEWIDDFVEWRILSDMLEDAGSHAALDSTTTVPCSLRIAWAERGRIVPYRRYGKPLRAVFPDAEFVRLPGVGHVPVYDDPDLVVRTILDVSTAALRPNA